MCAAYVSVRKLVNVQPTYVGLLVVLEQHSTKITLQACHDCDTWLICGKYMQSLSMAVMPEAALKVASPPSSDAPWTAGCNLTTTLPMHKWWLSKQLRT